MSKSRGLGKGLSALIPELEEAESEGRLEIPISEIRPNPYQPRRNFDQAKLEELANSIREHGVLQPILVRRVEDGYELIAGERRLRAAELAEMEKIPVVVGDFSGSALMQIALVENLQREDLNPIEEAEAYRQLMDEFQLTQEEIAQKVGKSRSAVANTLRLLNLPDSLRQALGEGKTTVGHARTILSLKTTEEQLQAWQKIASKGLSVREAEEMVRHMAEEEKRVPRETKNTKKDTRTTKDPNVEAMEDRIRQTLGTKVRIQPSGKGGRIEIEYYSGEELERILDKIIQ